jgi:hypothetical protein
METSMGMNSCRVICLSVVTLILVMVKKSEALTGTMDMRAITGAEQKVRKVDEDGNLNLVEDGASLYRQILTLRHTLLLNLLCLIQTEVRKQVTSFMRKLLNLQSDPSLVMS